MRAVREGSQEEGTFRPEAKDERKLARQGDGLKDIIGRRNNSCKSSEVRKRLTLTPALGLR